MKFGTVQIIPLWFDGASLRLGSNEPLKLYDGNKNLGKILVPPSVCQPGHCGHLSLAQVFNETKFKYEEEANPGVGPEEPS